MTTTNYTFTELQSRLRDEAYDAQRSEEAWEKQLDEAIEAEERGDDRSWRKHYQ